MAAAVGKVAEMRRILLHIYIPDAHVLELLEVDEMGRQRVLDRRVSNDTLALLGAEMSTVGMGVTHVRVCQPPGPPTHYLSYDGEELLPIETG